MVRGLFLKAIFTCGEEAKLGSVLDNSSPLLHMHEYLQHPYKEVLCNTSL